ncbi:MAG TPA: HlyD family efflux transporter periplasmic adaptor subunit, partial [Terriglobia bacterium]|nr:HlyD family efflux transporter periplasmic adaptor subunit [Terriglobia bacterium]
MVWLWSLLPLVALAASTRTAKILGWVAIALFAAGGVSYFLTRPRSSTIVLTGIVTTKDVIVSSQIPGRITTLTVKEGDAVARGQVVATIAPEELAADRAYYAHSAEGYSSQVSSSEAALRYQQEQTARQIQEAEARLAAAIAQQAEASANLENARLSWERIRELVEQDVLPREQLDQARTAHAAAQARLEAAAKQTEAQRAALALAQAAAEQVAMRQSQLRADQQQRAAAEAQRTKAEVRLAYTRLQAPVDGIVDVLAARLGEVVNPGQPVLTLINPDDLWVRADVEETYIDQIRMGDQFPLRLPSGEERRGTVFFRGLDAGFATQRAVSRT